ncbi:HAD family phosphatase [Streptomyces sp. NPDC002668]|uniref:HAD family hydrolase n=1 Tax=Streptomyces sp. NPDC002668 TaxID=3154422 RepID=UPI00332F581E
MSKALAVWTDFGGVLTPPIEVTMGAFCRVVAVPPPALRQAMYKVAQGYGTDVMAPLDTPLVSEEEWCRKVEEVLLKEHGLTTDLSDFAAKWFTDRQTNEAWLTKLRALRAEGVFLGLLSNMVPSWDKHWRQMVPDSLFDRVVLSFEVGHRKPEKGIFDLAARAAGVAPWQCVLVDDLEDNCEGARAAGWQSVRFTDTAAAAQRLDELQADVASTTSGR